MNTKINGVETRPVAVTGSQPVTRARDATTGDDSAASAAGGADVSITSGARQLADLEKAIAALPVVDDARVAATALALEQGRYEVDPQRIADRLIRLDQELSTAGSGDSGK
jgi:negative regulator of flagellin synthesis FlgM